MGLNRGNVLSRKASVEKVSFVNMFPKGCNRGTISHVERREFQRAMA